MEEKIKPWINLYLDDKHNLKTKLEYIQKEKNIIYKDTPSKKRGQRL